MNETDVIGHLIQIESEAANMLLDAQAEVDRRITEAKVKAENSYKEKYENLMQNLETEYEEKKLQIDTDCNSLFEEYKQKITSINQDKRTFNQKLDSYFFGRKNG